MSVADYRYPAGVSLSFAPGEWSAFMNGDTGGKSEV
jgi:hypothetical protein